MAQYTLDNVKLIRRPDKLLPDDGQSVGVPILGGLGSFDLIPLETGHAYNIEGKVFPILSDEDNIDNITLYLISDPDIGIIIPHIKKVRNNGFPVLSNGIDIDNIYNIRDFESYHTHQNSETYTYSFSGFIFKQPIFCHDSVEGWSVYIPRYKVNDEDVFFTQTQISNNIFSTFFESSDIQDDIYDVVISNKDIEETRFSQMAICKNGISMQNGLKYTIDKGGNANFNIGNIKSDSTSFLYYSKSDVPQLSGNNGLPNLLKVQFDSASYSKGDVLSGTSFTSTLSSILLNIFNRFDEENDILVCETVSGTAAKAVDWGDKTAVNPFKIRLKYKNTASNPTLNVTYKSVSYPDGHTATWPLRLEDNVVTDIPAGYYQVECKTVNNTTYFNLTRISNVLFDQINAFSKKVSNYDILLVKK